MLKLFACGAVGEKFEAEDEFNIEEIRRLAIEQGVWQTVFAGINDTVKCGNLAIQPECFAQFRAGVFASVRESIVRNVFTENVLENSGLEYCVLKGRTVSRFYKYPDMRVSGDVDVLIKEKDAALWRKYLRGKGYEVDRQSRVSHHFGAVHPTGGLVEIHTKMYYDIMGEILLKNLADYSEPYIMCGGLPSLGVNDALLFITVHLIKHFIGGAVGIRQIGDLILYAWNNKDKIDWDKYNSLMTALDFDGFVSAVWAIGNRYFGTEFENADYGRADVLLDDAEKKGDFGKNAGFDNFSYVFLKQRSGMCGRDFDKYYNKTSRESVLYRMFPRVKSLEKQYPRLKKFPFLLPLYQCIRLADIFLKVVRKERSINNLPQKENLMIKQKNGTCKKLGMIK